MSLLTRITLPNGALANDSQTFLGAGALFTTGQVLFVCSVTGSDGNPGTDPSAPLATIQQAVTNSRANKGDKVIVMPGHAETVTSTSINLSKAGISFICLGTGLERPTFTYSTAAATINVSAANCAFIGGHHIANFADVAAAFTLAAAKDFKCYDNTFVETGTDLNWFNIIVTGSTNNAADGLDFSRNYVLQQDAAAKASISVLGNLNRLVANDNVCITAATSDAAQFMTCSSKVLLGAQVLRNRLVITGDNNASTVGLFQTGSSTTSTGIIAFNTVNSLDTTTALFNTASQGFALQENYVSGAVDKSGTLYPAADNPA